MSPADATPGEALDAQLALLQAADAAHDVSLGEDDTALADHDDRIAELEAWRAAHNAFTLEQDLRFAALEADVQALTERVAALETPPVDTDPLTGAFFTHCPLDWGGLEVGPKVRERVTAGICNGVFLYRPKDKPLAWTNVEQGLVDSGPPIPVTVSPKNVSDPLLLEEWAATWPAEWRPYVLAEYWQEPQGDFIGREAEFHGQVSYLADCLAVYGIRSGVHLETWHLSPSQPDGGTEGARALLEPVLDRLSFVTWSLFEFNLKDACVDHVGRAAEFMAAYPDVTWGITAVGVSVPYGTATDEQRSTRCDLLGGIYAAQIETTASLSGHYSLPQGRVATRDYLDEQVEALLRAWV